MSDCMKCALSDVIDAHGGWDSAERSIVRGSRNIDGFEVIDYFFDPMPDDYYGEFSQGHEGNLYMVFKRDERFFRKEGKGDSYGTHYWTGNLKEAFPKRVERIVYEYTFEKEN
jgi:hypothetical protein